jgi:hypothetical protein
MNKPFCKEGEEMIQLDNHRRLDRGSRKHVLDWTGQESFLTEFENFLAPCPVHFPTETKYMPQGIKSPKEARLEKFGPSWMPGNRAWPAIKDWWLCHKKGANTPNWDIAVGCEIEGRLGLVLVEAKAHKSELSKAGKPKRSNASKKSLENHDHIASAIEKAQSGWQNFNKGVHITRDSHYQLANRLAFTWKLASLKIPVILVYLGFTGDQGIRNLGEPFVNDNDWRVAFTNYVSEVFPIELFGKRLEVEGTPMWLLLRSRPIIEMSPSSNSKYP